MKPLSRETFQNAREIDAEADLAWKKAQPYFRARGGVVFFSQGRFWESHGFVQQSLAYLLSEAGIGVTWLDGMNWRAQKAHVASPNRFLKVQTTLRLPLRRFKPLARMSDRFEIEQIKAAQKAFGPSALLWVQDGMEETLAQELNADIFSAFDDPYAQSPEGALCEKAKLIITQNRHAYRRFSAVHPEKTLLNHPPMFVSMAEPAVKAVDLPSEFPSTAMGYVGSCLASGFDFILLEDFLKSAPEIGFILMGRTSEEGKNYLQKLSVYKNFAYFPPASARAAQAVWQRLSLSLLLYRPLRTQDGAFPVKALDSLSYGISMVGTRVPKTLDLSPDFPLSNFPGQLKRMAFEELARPKSDLENYYLKLYREMHPKFYLARVAEALQKKS